MQVGTVIAEKKAKDHDRDNERSVVPCDFSMIKHGAPVPRQRIKRSLNAIIRPPNRSTTNLRRLRKRLVLFSLASVPLIYARANFSDLADGRNPAARRRLPDFFRSLPRVSLSRLAGFPNRARFSHSSRLSLWYPVPLRGDTRFSRRYPTFTLLSNLSPRVRVRGIKSLTNEIPAASGEPEARKLTLIPVKVASAIIFSALPVPAVIATAGKQRGAEPSRAETRRGFPLPRGRANFSIRAFSRAVPRSR